MTRLQKTAVLTKLVERLRERGSWSGETHIQKAVYFLQELLKVPLEFNFILYKHGPFSFDLREELGAAYADGLLKLKAQPLPYGPSIVSTPETGDLQSRFSKTLRIYERQIDFVADRLGVKKVSELEGLATALYIKFNGAEAGDPAQELHRLKPHITVKQAESFVDELELLLEEGIGLLSEIGSV